MIVHILYNRFEGMAVKIDPAGLAEGLAETCTNAGFSRGFLSAVPVDFSEIAFSDLKATVVGSLSRANGVYYSHSADAWFLWPQKVVRGVDSLIAPVDEHERIYFADDTGPRFMVATQYTKDAVNLNRPSFRLGIPFPTSAPSATKDSESLDPDVDPDSVVRQRTRYIFTLVDDFGHEGPPSDASNVVTVPVEYDFQVTVSMPLGSTDLSGRSFTDPNAQKFVYRATEGSERAQYQFVGQVPVGTTDFVDTVPVGAESETILSVDWFEPPEEIAEIAAVASNFLAGFFGNMLCFTHPKLPHAWPLVFRFPIKYQIVGIMPTANGLFVGTTGKPYWCYGGDPEAAIPVELNQDFPCVSAESIVDVGGFVVYASHDGLVAIDGQQAILITEDAFDRIDWQALDPANIKAFSYEGRYMFTSPATGDLFSIMPGNPRTITLMDFQGNSEIFQDISAFEHSIRFDRSVIAFASASNPIIMEVINEFAIGTSWTSRLQLTPLIRFNFLRVRATEYPLDITIHSESNSPVTITVPNEKPIRIGPRFQKKSRLWGVTIEIEGSAGGLVRDVMLTQSSEEFANVP